MEYQLLHHIALLYSELQSLERTIAVQHNWSNLLPPCSRPRDKGQNLLRALTDAISSFMGTPYVSCLAEIPVPLPASHLLQSHQIL